MQTLISIFVNGEDQPTLEGLLMDLSEVLKENGFVTEAGEDSELRSVIIVSDTTVNDLERKLGESTYIIIPQLQKETA